MVDNLDLIERNETNRNSKGGTELLQERLYDGRVPRHLLEQFQIIFSRARGLDESKFRIFYAHDLPGDPESDILRSEGWRKFHKIVFVSHWQMQAYINYYAIPWSHCEVIENSIVPLEPNTEPSDTIRMVYTSTPHRGLDVLYSSFNELTKHVNNIHLDVFSSFKLYDWGDRDEQYRDLFNALDAHPNITNHGTVSNEEIRKHLETKADIFVYPSIWPETSCLCLIEAMSAGLICIHSDYGALSDTAPVGTYMYHYDEDKNKHATKLFGILMGAVQYFNSDDVKVRKSIGRYFANSRFNHELSAERWKALLASIIAENPEKKIEDVYVYRA